MKFKLDFDDLEELQKLLGEVAESVEEFEETFSNIIDEVMDNSSGKALEKITEISEDLLPTLKEVAVGYQDQADIAKDYIEGIRNINEDKSGVYELDTSEAKGYIKDVTNQLEKVEELNKESVSLNIFENSYENKIREYNSVESCINLETDYENDEDTKALIRSKRIEINNYISNYNNNQMQLESAQDVLISLNSALIDYIDDLAGYKDLLEDLTDFEETFNPGFWDKHGQQIKTIITIVGLFAGSPLAVILAGLELAIAIGEGEGIAGAALGLIPGEKVLGAAGDVLKRADGKVAEVGKKALNKADELTPGCFKCMMG